MRFKLFMEAVGRPAQIVSVAQEARKQEGVKCAVFGDCNAVCDLTVKLLGKMGIQAKRVGGHFRASSSDSRYNFSGENSDSEHSWVLVEGYILDPTIDQFFSELDEDMHTKVEGIYFSHPEWDGNRYVKRYQK